MNHFYFRLETFFQSMLEIYLECLLNVLFTLLFSECENCQIVKKYVQRLIILLCPLTCQKCQGISGRSTFNMNDLDHACDFSVLDQETIDLLGYLEKIFANVLQERLNGSV